ncbi:MAG: response regulator [Candidatus Acidiferrales bacterium]
MGFTAKILVVHHDPKMVEVLRRTLAKIDMDTVSVPSVEEAVPLINRTKFDAVFLEWFPPQMEGLKLAEQVRWSKTNSTIPMIMLTSNTEPDALRQCFRVGINFFLQEPASPSQIERLVASARDLMMQERVRYQRVALSVPVHCRWSVQSYEQKCTGETVNLSTSGLLAKMDLMPTPGGSVDLKFSLPGMRQAFTGTGFVVRFAPNGLVGMRFVNLSGGQRQRLTAFSKAALAGSIASAQA